MGRDWQAIRKIFHSIGTLLWRLVFAIIGPSDISPNPRGEAEFVLDRRQLGPDPEGYAASAGEVFRAVVEKSPRHAVAIHLWRGAIHAPAGMQLLADHTDLTADWTPDGRVVANPKSIDAVARLLGPELISESVIDDEKRPIIQGREGEALRFCLPPGASDRLFERLPEAAAAACRRTDTVR